MAGGKLHLVLLWTCLCCLLAHAADTETTTNPATVQTVGETSSTTSSINTNIGTALAEIITPEPEPISEPTPKIEPEPTSEPRSELELNATSEPTPKVEPEPTSEPTAKPEPESEPTAESEPEPESESTASSEPEPETTELPPFAEPVPDWDLALSLYGVFWYIHIYILGSLFALLAIYSFVSLVRLRKRRLLSQGYFVALNLMMLIMGLDRAVYLFVDAYNHKEIFPLPLAYMLLGMGFPCLSSAFSILFLALLNSTKTRLVSPKVQQSKALAAMITFHFTVSIVVDVIVGLFTKAQVLLLLCQGVFLIWGLFLSISYLVIFRRLHISSMRQFRELSRLSMSKRTSSLYGISPFMKKPRNNWSSAIKVTLFTSFFGVTIGLLQLYGILVVYGPLGEKIPEPWSWVWYQLAFRVCEFAMCALMSYVATQPFRYTASGREKPMCMGCACKKDIFNVFARKTSHELNAQDVDSYRLVSGDMDATFPGNEYIANLQPQVSPSGFKVDAPPVSDGKITFKPKTPHSKDTNELVADNKKDVLALKMPDHSVTFEGDNTAVGNNTSFPASAPVRSTQYSTPFKDNIAHSCLVKTNQTLGARIPNGNKNNHHSCPSTPLQERSPSLEQKAFPPRLSLSSLQSLGEKSSALAPVENEQTVDVPEDASRCPDSLLCTQGADEQRPEQISDVRTDTWTRHESTLRQISIVSENTDL